MARRTDLKIPYGIADFKRIRNEGWYYVDKTRFLAKLEERDSFVFFVRPRRFGKSLFISMMQAEFGHIRYYLAKPEMELARGYCDFCLFPERVYNGDVRDSYIIELKYSKPDATDAEIAAKAQEGIAQLKRYAADPFVPALAAGTRLHCLLYHFQGTALIRAEEIEMQGVAGLHGDQGNRMARPGGRSPSFAPPSSPSFAPPHNWGCGLQAAPPTHYDPDPIGDRTSE